MSQWIIEWKALYAGETTVEADSREEAKELLGEELAGSGWAFERDDEPEVELIAYESVSDAE